MDYSKLTISKLKTCIQQKGIRRVPSNYKKQQLINLLIEIDKKTTALKSKTIEESDKTIAIESLITFTKSLLDSFDFFAKQETDVLKDSIQEFQQLIKDIDNLNELKETVLLVFLSRLNLANIYQNMWFKCMSMVKHIDNKSKNKNKLIRTYHEIDMTFFPSFPSVAQGLNCIRKTTDTWNGMELNHYELVEPYDIPTLSGLTDNDDFYGTVIPYHDHKLVFMDYNDVIVANKSCGEIHLGQFISSNFQEDDIYFYENGWNDLKLPKIK